MSNLENKRIAVTGAAGRLGSHLVSALGAHGARVLAIIRDPDKARLLPVGPGAAITTYVTNVTSSESVGKTFDVIAEDEGGLDGLIHTAGGWAMVPFLESTDEDWKTLLDLNLTSAFLCFRAAARLMSAGSGGSLVGIASAQGADRGAAGQCAYSASKGGLVRLVESIDAELAASGIRAAAVAPSTILFGPESGAAGVPAAKVVAECLRLVAGAADGKVHRVYGSAS